MRKLLLLLLILLPALHVSADDINALMLHLSSGKTATIPLCVNPLITVNGDNIALRTDVWNVNIPSSNVEKITYESVDIVGDVNLDKKINVSDVSQAIKVLNGSEQQTVYDVNKDGVVNAKDVEDIKSLILGKKMVIDGKVSSYDIQNSEGEQKADDAMYVYRSDDDFNAFIKSEVDSVAYSYLDADGVAHNDWQMQEIYTADSIYRIPLAAIDSISFVTPEPIYKDDVMVLDNAYSKYIVSYTDSTIVFSSDIPSSLMPGTGQIVVGGDDNTTFVDGFAGRMTGSQSDSGNTLCTFESVRLDEVYSRLVGVGYVDSYNEDDGDSQSSKRKMKGIGDNVNIKLPHSLPYSLKSGNSSITGKLSEPSLRVNYAFWINEKLLKNYVKFNYHFNSEGDITAKISDELSDENTVWSEYVHFTVYGVPGTIRIGAFCDFSGSAELEAVFPFTVDSYGGFEYKENTGFTPFPGNSTIKWERPDWSLNLNGSVYFGFVPEIAIGIAWKKIKIVQADIQVKAGVELSSSFKLTSEDVISPSLYNTLKDVEVEESLKVVVSPGYYVILGGDRKEIVNIPAFIPWKTSAKLVPAISDPKWKYLGSKKGTLNASVSDDTFLPCSLGWAMYDGDELVRKEYFPDNYWISDDWTNSGLQKTFTDLPESFSYKAYPIVNLCGVEMRVPESVRIMSDIPVKITGFKQTSSEYSKGGYSNDGAWYDYKFNAATTVAFNEDADISDVDDWGYVYKDPEGNVKLISLKAHSSPYTDTSYAYYRNVASSTACLCSYVKYVGEEEYYYDTPKNYSLVYEQPEPKWMCPDGNHPHMIDLGLPSGTKWCCCNVGATSPEQDGGYYAWGETSEKSIYYHLSYPYVSGTDLDGDGFFDCELDAKDIGSDIAGTAYDVAHMNMGGSWVMPSTTQQQELIDNCTREWVSTVLVSPNTFRYNYGILLTGPNGGQIFLPAAGYRSKNETLDMMSSCYYWSSTICSLRGAGASYILYSDYKLWRCAADDRSFGLSVRAVCK